MSGRMPAQRTDIAPVEAMVVVLVCFGYFIALSSEMAFKGLPIRFGDAELISGSFYQILFAAVALTFLHARNYAIATLYPRPTFAGIGWSIILLGLAYGAGEIVVLPFGSGAADASITQAVALADAALATIVLSAIVNGAFEEVFLLGFLQRGLMRHGAVIALGTALFVRVLYHSYQGIYGMVGVLAFGLVLGVYYFRTRALFPVAFAHILADILPFTWRA